MITQSAGLTEVYTTEHPYIVRVRGICGGRPILKDTRISVRYIAELYKAGALVDEILFTHPELTAAAVYDAISYYLDHQTELEQEILDNRVEMLMTKHDFSLDERCFVRFHQPKVAPEEPESSRPFYCALCR